MSLGQGSNRVMTSSVVPRGCHAPMISGRKGTSPLKVHNPMLTMRKRIGQTHTGGHSTGPLHVHAEDCPMEDCETVPDQRRLGRHDRCTHCAALDGHLEQNRDVSGTPWCNPRWPGVELIMTCQSNVGVFVWRDAPRCCTTVTVEKWADRCLRSSSVVYSCSK